MDPNVDEAVIFTKLECESIYDAEPGYSEWLQQELMDEWKAQKPFISDLLVAIQSHGSTNISKEALQAQLAALSKVLNSIQVVECLRFLFDNSVIGLKLGSSNQWKYKCNYQSRVWQESPEYRVHEVGTRPKSDGNSESRRCSGRDCVANGRAERAWRSIRVSLVDGSNVSRQVLETVGTAVGRWQYAERCEFELRAISRFPARFRLQRRYDGLSCLNYFFSDPFNVDAALHSG